MNPIPRAAITLIAALALLASACGSSDDAGVPSADGATSTSASVPATTPSAVADDAGPDDDDTSDGPDDEEADRDDEETSDELAAEDVPAYVAAYEDALTTSTLRVGDGDPTPIDRAEFIDALTVRSGSDTVEFVLGGAGVEEVVATIDGAVWSTDDQATMAELSADVDQLEPGDTWETTITVADATDPTTEQTVQVRLDTDLIGGGDSTIEVVDGGADQAVATISGVLGTETYLQLQDVIEANPDVDTLVMLSVEGSENDAINLHTSRLIRQAGWTTWLPASGDISSGGVDMFLAGQERIIEPGGFLGVHSWGSSDGDVVATDLPDDHPAHRAQLDYVTEMLGAGIGPDFYFYTLEAAPASSIHRMTPEEVETYGLATEPADTPLPASVTGPPAGYLQLADQIYLKHRVLGCEIEGETVTAKLESEELGQVDVEATGDNGQLTWTDLPPDLTATHPVVGVSVDGGQVTLDTDLDFDDLIGQDTSGADLTIDCR